MLKYIFPFQIDDLPIIPVQKMNKCFGTGNVFLILQLIDLIFKPVDLASVLFCLSSNQFSGR